MWAAAAREAVRDGGSCEVEGRGKCLVGLEGREGCGLQDALKTAEYNPIISCKETPAPIMFARGVFVLPATTCPEMERKSLSGISSR
ncbi:hypothetical protein E2C01_026857 [Portunus trituberculatus]|uniref:Uncharacterized protein n=1 Tax=Portunus trituberculatus TaxID=210409 RepID=A0A5B7EJA2_PORTR|nr:hypothetical protein [Portunus trituberculatus]